MCEFGREKFIYLGHRIGGGVLSVPEDRVCYTTTFVRSPNGSWEASLVYVIITAASSETSTDILHSFHTTHLFWRSSDGRVDLCQSRRLS